MLTAILTCTLLLRSASRGLSTHEVQSHYNAYIQTYVQYYSCICVYLTDVDECTDGVTVVECGVNAHCVNFVGSFNCSCLEGYEGNATTLCESKHSLDDICLLMLWFYIAFYYNCILWIMIGCYLKMVHTDLKHR